MKQQTFSDIEYSNRKRTTKKEEFLKSMEEIIPWDHWINLIREHYPSGKRGRPPRGIETMLRMYLLQNWFSLSDEGAWDAIYDSYAMRSFMRINFLEEQVPDATTLLKFRHLLEEHNIGEQIFADVSDRLEKAGLIMRGGTVVDATIIAAPGSTKNRAGKRDAEMHQTKKGNQWYFGMKVHSGVDAGSGYVHTITGTAANVHDVNETEKLIRDDDDVVYGDSAYLNAASHLPSMAPERVASIDFRVNARPSSVKMPKEYEGFRWDEDIESRKSSTRCKVEHPFLIVKRQFGYCKAAYKGIAKKHEPF